MALNWAQTLAGLPVGLRSPLIAAYVEMARNYSERRWEPSELNGGKLCEVIYSIVDGATAGSYPANPKKPARFIDACRAIEQRPANPGLAGDRSLRILIPRLLPYLYEIRNNRGVGHIGGDVDPNFSDASVVFACSNWLMAELIRIFHSIPLHEAQATVDSMVERRHPVIWETNGKKRVLARGMSIADQVLVLLYSSNGWVDENDLREWIGTSNSTNFRNRHLKPLHKSRVLEYDSAARKACISPLGSNEVERRILAKHGSPMSQQIIRL